MGSDQPRIQTIAGPDEASGPDASSGKVAGVLPVRGEDERAVSGSRYPARIGNELFAMNLDKSALAPKEVAASSELYPLVWLALLFPSIPRLFSVDKNNRSVI
jgi:hypothetical protein